MKRRENLANDYSVSKASGGNKRRTVFPFGNSRRSDEIRVKN